MNWLKIGSLAAPYIATIIICLGLFALTFRRFVAPGIVEALEEASKTSKTLASLGGLKKADWEDGKQLEEIITKELLMDKMPELEFLRLALSPSSWEQVEEIIENNPAAALKIYEKYAPLIGGSKPKQEFNF